MEIKEFIEKFADAVELENVQDLSSDTKFKELEDWSSISVMLTIAFFDEEFNKEIGGSDMRECTTIEDLYNLINK